MDSIGKLCFSSRADEAEAQSIPPEPHGTDLSASCVGDAFMRVASGEMLTHGLTS